MGNRLTITISRHYDTSGVCVDGCTVRKCTACYAAYPVETAGSFRYCPYCAVPVVDYVPAPPADKSRRDIKRAYLACVRYKWTGEMAWSIWNEHAGDYSHWDTYCGLSRFRNPSNKGPVYASILASFREHIADCRNNRDEYPTGPIEFQIRHYGNP